MSYDIKHGPLVAERIKSWDLPEPLLAELEFRLVEDLRDNPARNLHIITNDPDYLEYSFASDIMHGGARYLFAFRVAYSTDEQTLLLLDADCIAVPD